jgi:alkaline phosphatase
MGGGRRHFTSILDRDPQRPNEFGRRLDNRNLIESWLLDKKERGLEARYIKDKSEFDALNTSRVDYLLGIQLIKV